MKPVLGNAVPVLGVKPNGGSTYFGNFTTYAYVKPRQWKAIAETFSVIWLNMGLP